EISFRKPETVSSASNRVSESDIRSWLDSVNKETSFYMHPRTKKVLAQKNVYEIKKASTNQNTVMISFSMVHLDVILPEQKIRKEVIQGFPSAGQSERSWMNTNNFRDYIEKVFHACLVKECTTFPIILFVDGHVSHKSIEVADVCQAHGFFLIALYPYSTRMLHTAQVTGLKPLKDAWGISLEKRRFEHAIENFTLNCFGQMLETAIKNGIKTNSIESGLQACGLHTLTLENLAFSNCLNKRPPQSNHDDETT
uniref:DDE-1 domain-containing protein n=1 Tax=Anopheles funestus TaxID=62324 RepID=A0A182RZX0_ANOFN